MSARVVTLAGFLLLGTGARAACVFDADFEITNPFDPTCGGVVLTYTEDDNAGSNVALSPTEYKLLRYLLVNQGRVVSKAQILDHVWQYDFGGDGGVVFLKNSEKLSLLMRSRTRSWATMTDPFAARFSLPPV